MPFTRLIQIDIERDAPPQLTGFHAGPGAADEFEPGDQRFSDALPCDSGGLVDEIGWQVCGDPSDHTPMLNQI